MKRRGGYDEVELLIEVVTQEVGLDEPHRPLECLRSGSLDHRSIRVDSRHSKTEPVCQAPGEAAVTTSHVQSILATGGDLTQKQVCIVLVVVVLKHDAFRSGCPPC